MKQLALIKALKDDNFEEAKDCLTLMCTEDLNEVDEEGKTSLHWAVISKQTELAKELYEKMSEYARNAIDNKNMTALNYASVTEDVNLIAAVSGENIEVLKENLSSEKDIKESNNPENKEINIWEIKPYKTNSPINFEENYMEPLGEEVEDQTQIY